MGVWGKSWSQPLPTLGTVQPLPQLLPFLSALLQLLWGFCCTFRPQEPCVPHPKQSQPVRRMGWEDLGVRRSRVHWWELLPLLGSCLLPGATCLLGSTCLGVLSPGALPASGGAHVKPIKSLRKGSMTVGNHSVGFLKRVHENTVWFSDKFETALLNPLQRCYC